MDDLISRAAILARFKALQEYDPEYEGRGWACNFLNDSREPSTEWYCVEDVVEDVPAVDAAPVVRCKDCKYWKDQSETPKWLPCSEIRTNGNWFCADGERRDAEKEGTTDE